MQLRERLLTTLFNAVNGPYARLFKRSVQPWNLTNDDLLQMPAHTLGWALGAHMKALGYTLMPKLEDHDVYHLLTEIQTDVSSEIELSYFLLGNGKRSLFVLGVTVLGGLLFCDHARRFRDAYRRGGRLQPVFKLPYRHLLLQPLPLVRALFERPMPTNAVCDSPLSLGTS